MDSAPTSSDACKWCGEKVGEAGVIFHLMICEKRPAPDGSGIIRIVKPRRYEVGE